MPFLQCGLGVWSRADAGPMMAAMATLDRARAAYRRMAWAESFAQFQSAEAEAELTAPDLELASQAAHLSGNDRDALALFARGVQRAETSGDIERAARCAYSVGMLLMQRGELAPAEGWWARARRLVDEHHIDSAIVGHLLIPRALQALFRGDAAISYPGFTEVLQVGERFADVDLIALGRLGMGRSLVLLGRSAEGIAALDEAMVSVTVGEVSPQFAGIVYCSVIECCYNLLDLRRAREWTDALTRWCDSQPELVPFRGQCLIHRAEIMRLAGSWSEAETEAALAYERLGTPPAHPAIADAVYERAEIHRLRGEYDAAEASYREASERGREPQPGLALLRLAQDQPAAAEAAIRRVVAGREVRSERVQLLAAFIEIVLSVGDLAAARLAADELDELVATMSASFLDALAAYTSGAIALADGNALEAIDHARRAWSLWCDLETPYEAARARVLIARACRELGDTDTAAMELDTARRTFADLGAAPDVARVDAMATATTSAGPAGLTGREIEVLELIAAGRTNREIAAALVISEKTVARHAANIFVKLDVSTRTAASAYAFKHGLA